MPFFSWQSIDATPARVARALSDAATACGPARGQAPPDEEALLPGSEDGAQAVVLARGAWVGLARWTDPLGRKHRHVEGASADPDSHDHRFLNGAPPEGPPETAALRVIAPERVLLRNGTEL